MSPSPRSCHRRARWFRLRCTSCSRQSPGHYTDHAKGRRRSAENLRAAVRGRKAGAEEGRGAEGRSRQTCRGTKQAEQAKAEAAKAEAAKKAEAEKAADRSARPISPRSALRKKRRKKPLKRPRKRPLQKRPKKKAAAAEAAKKKAAEDAKRKAEDARRKAAEDQKAAALAELLSDNVQNQQALAETHGDQVAGNLDDLIIKLITENWQRPMSARRGMSVELLIQMLPDGTITNASVSRSSGDAPFDNSAVAAVRNVGRISRDATIGSRYLRPYVQAASRHFQTGGLSAVNNLIRIALLGWSCWSVASRRPIRW